MGLRPVAIDNANEKGRDALLNILRARRVYHSRSQTETALSDVITIFVRCVLMNALVSMMDSGRGWLGALMR